MKVDKDDVVYFGSAMGSEVGYLTNFARSRITVRGYTFPSSEHAFQAFLRLRPDDVHRMSVDGDLGGSLEECIPKVFKAAEVDRKLKHYGAKKTGKPDMIGIVAKMAVKPDVAKKLNLRMLHAYEYEHSIEEMGNLFMEILAAKYDQNPVARDQLLRTSTKHLVEFGKGAVRESAAGKSPLWTGLVHEGTLVGMNFQGELQMKIRSMMQSTS